MIFLHSATLKKHLFIKTSLSSAISQLKNPQQQQKAKKKDETLPCMCGCAEYGG